jgi:uncharacterized protein YjiS (DUF1127 family)
MSNTSNALVGREAVTRSAQTPTRACLCRVGSTARRLWHTYWDHQARRATAMILQALDDRALADIGFQRSEIEPMVFGQTPELRRPYDVKWRHRAGF